MNKINAVCAFPIALFPLFAAATHVGEGTFYDYGGGGNCSFVTVPNDILAAAMNATDYEGSAACGGVIEVTNPNTGLSVTVRIDDQCPECAPGDVDLDQRAFAKIATISAGRIPISWRYIANPVAGNMKLYFKEGSSQWWTAIQVRDHLYRVASVEYRITGSGNDYVSLPRMPYNYFVASSGFGVGPYDFRVTDVWGQVVEVEGISLALTTEIDTGTQFPLHDDAGNGSGDTTGVGLDNVTDVSSENTTRNGSTNGNIEPKSGAMLAPAETTLSTISSWNTGYCSTVTVRNPNTSELTWTVELEVDATIYNLWNAEWTQSGTALTASGVFWNATLAAGGSTEFGFCANDSVKRFTPAFTSGNSIEK